MPDFFIPYDTAGITPFFMRINQAGLIYRYALTWSDTHREELSVFNEVEELSDYLDSQNLISSFRDHVAQRGYVPTANEWQESLLIIKTQLKAYIARNFLDNDGFYPIIQQIDNTLNQAVVILETKTL